MAPRTPSSLPRRHTPPGETAITPALVQELVRSAASEVPGVTAVRETPDRLRSIRQFLHLNGPESIRLDPAGTQVTIDVAVEIAYGTPIPEIVQKIRRAVANRVTEYTGCEVEAVNVIVADIAGQVTEVGTRAHVK